VESAGSRIPMANDHIAGMGGQSRLASGYVQNLASGFQDLGVKIAGGANPMKEFIRQGSQLGGITMEAGVGIRGFVGAVAGMVAPFLPAIAVVGALAASVALMTSDINKNSEVTVTWRDTVGGVFDYLKDLLNKGLTAAFAYFGTSTGQVWASVVNATRTAINAIVGAIAGLYKTIAGVGQALKTIFTTGDFRSAGQVLATTVSTAFKEAFSRDFIGEAAAAISPFAQARAAKRLEDDAKSAGRKTGKDFVDSLEDYIAKNAGRVTRALDRVIASTSTLPNAEREFRRMVDEIEARRAGERALAAAELASQIEIAERYHDKFLNVATRAADIFGGSVGRAADRLAQIISRDFPDMAIEIGRLFDSLSAGLSNAISAIGKAAGFGGAVGSLIGGGQFAQIGGAIGSAAGQAIGKGIAALGKMGGPIGMVVGSILGSLAGGLIKGVTPRAFQNLSTDMSGQFTRSFGGARGSGQEQNMAASIALADEVGNTLTQLATALGGTLKAGLQLGAIGPARGRFDFFTNPTTTSGYNTGGQVMSFATAEEAVAAAIQNAVNIGAFEGVREGTLKILQAGGDLAANIQSAIALEQTFRDMEIALDPVGVALRELETRFDNMRSLLERGGATTEELAKLEQWYSQERVRLANNEAAALESLGSASREAAAAMRAAAQEQQRIAQQRYGLETRILQLEGNTAELRARELAQIDESNRALQEQIYALEDQRAAQERAAQAAQAAAAQAAEAQRRIEEARRQAFNNLRSAINAERSIIEQRLNPLQSQLERLTEALTPSPPDLVAALQVRDLLSEGLDLASRIARSARGLMGDNQQIVAMQRDAARRELFRMVETRRIDAERIDDLISQATQFGQAASREAMMLDRARTANLLMQLAGIQEEQSRAAQAVEDERAANAEQAVRDQIALLQSQISIEERSLARLDQIAERFLSLDNAVMSVAQALRALGFNDVPAFANGGMHGGGLAIVGEQGPELVNMGPARVFSSGQTQAIMRGQADEQVKDELVKQNEYLRELVKLNAKQERTLREIELQGEPA